MTLIHFILFDLQAHVQALKKSSQHHVQSTPLRQTHHVPRYCGTVVDEGRCRLSNWISHKRSEHHWPSSFEGPIWQPGLRQIQFIVTWTHPWPSILAPVDCTTLPPLLLSIHTKSVLVTQFLAVRTSLPHWTPITHTDRQNSCLSITKSNPRPSNS